MQRSAGSCFASSRAQADGPCEEGVEIFAPGPAAGGPDRAEKRGEATARAFCEIGRAGYFQGDRKRASFAVGMSALRRPRCPAWGEARGLPGYRCVECRETFNPFHRRSGGLGLHQKGSLARSGARLDGGGEPGQGGRALPHPPEHRLPVTPRSTSTSLRAFRASSKPMRSSSSCRSRVGGAVLPDPRVAAAPKPP
jgi:hypothetical protein